MSDNRARHVCTSSGVEANRPKRPTDVAGGASSPSLGQLVSSITINSSLGSPELACARRNRCAGSLTSVPGRYKQADTTDHL